MISGPVTHGQWEGQRGRSLEVQPWARSLDLAGTAGASQRVGAHAVAAGLGVLCRAGSSRKGGPFGLVQPHWHLVQWLRAGVQRPKLGTDQLGDLEQFI